MDEAPSRRAGVHEDERGSRLESWKDIASYLGRGVTTVQRWEQEDGLPIHRLPHAKKGSVFAFREELETWRAERARLGARRPHHAEKVPVTAALDERPRRARGSAAMAWTVAGLLTVTTAGLWFVRQAGSHSQVSGPTLLHDPVPLATDIGSETSPSLSPDGSGVVYHWRRSDGSGLYIKPVAGGVPRPLRLDGLPAGATARHPRWSPRADLVAFQVVEAPDRRGIYTVPRAGGRVTRLTQMAGTGLCWAPNGRAVAFADRGATGEPFSIFSFDIPTGVRRRLTTAPAGSFGDTECAFSPDGTTLAVARYLSRFQSDVYLVPIQPFGPAEGTRVTTDVEGITGLDWAPDGSVIVFSTHTGLWQTPPSPDALGTPARLFRMAGASASSPSFSRTFRSGTVRLAYEHNVRDVNVWRWELDAAGHEVVARLEGSTWWDDHPALSADGRQVAFASNRSGSGEIWTAGRDGKDPTRVTFHAGPVVISPQWSPDQKRIAYTSQDGGNRDVYLAEADGSRSSRLTSDLSQEEFPSWSRDGRSIYFKSNRDGASRIWKAPVTGDPPVRITVGEGSQSFESLDGSRLYFTRSVDTPGLWVVPSNGGAERLLVPDVRESFWGVVERGIVYLDGDSQPQVGHTILWFFDDVTGKKRVLGTIPARRRSIMPGFAVAPDGRTVLWTSLDVSQSDVMIFDSWK